MTTLTFGLAVQLQAVLFQEMGLTVDEVNAAMRPLVRALLAGEAGAIDTALDHFHFTRDELAALADTTKDG